jgi:Basic region leucine zipper
MTPHNSAEFAQFSHGDLLYPMLHSQPSTSPPLRSVEPRFPERNIQPDHHVISSRPVSNSLALKRQKNNIAAKRYRQKKIDRIAELEQKVQIVMREKENLKLELAKRETEVQMLRELLLQKKE